MGFPGGAGGKESACRCGRCKEKQVRSLGREDPLEQGLATHSRVLVWENPVDRGAWGAAGHRVVKSRTRLSESTRGKIHTGRLSAPVTFAMSCVLSQGERITTPGN